MSSDTSTVGGIQGYLLKLHSFLGETENRNAAIVCHDIIGDLGQECMITKNENELGKIFFHSKSIALCSYKMQKQMFLFIAFMPIFYTYKQSDYSGTWSRLSDRDL